MGILTGCVQWSQGSHGTQVRRWTRRWTYRHTKRLDWPIAGQSLCIRGLSRILFMLHGAPAFHLTLRSPQPPRYLFEMAPEHPHYTQLALLACVLAVKKDLIPLTKPKLKPNHPRSLCGHTPSMEWGDRPRGVCTGCWRSYISQLQRPPRGIGWEMISPPQCCYHPRAH